MADESLAMSQLYEAILVGDAALAVGQTQAALAAGLEPQNLVTDYMIPAMDEVGRRFEAQQYFVPELLIAARAMKKALEILRPLLAERGIQPIGRVVIGTIQGDLHDIGKGLVASMLEGGGFEVIDLGVDVTPQKFVEHAQETRADLIAVSALLTTTMAGMRAVVQAVRDAGMHQSCRIIVGGAPVTQQFADAIGADGYSSNGTGAVSLARQLLVARNAPGGQ